MVGFAALTFKVGKQKTGAEHLQPVKPSHGIKPLGQRPQAVAGCVQAEIRAMGKYIRQLRRGRFALPLALRLAALGFAPFGRVLLRIRIGENRCVLAFMQQGDEVSLAADFVRIQVDIALFPVRQAGKMDGRGRKLRMDGEEAGKHALVLRIVKGAGGIDHHAAGGEHLCRLLQNLHGAVRAAAGAVFAPLVPRLRLPPEHALARAWRIDKDAVKERREVRCELVGHAACDHGVFNAHALDVARENLRAGGHGLVANEQPPALQQRGNLRALAAGRGAQVEHALSGLGVKRAHGGEGARLLQVKKTALVQGVKPRARVSLHKIAALCPRHRRAETVDIAGRHAVRAGEQVDAQRAGHGLPKGFFIRKKACFTEQAFHLVDIGGWQLVHSSSYAFNLFSS